MKTIIFSNAIFNHCRIRFLYEMKEVILDPYFVTFDSCGKKMLYGKTPDNTEICHFRFSRITNIRLLNSLKIAPEIPVISQISIN